MSAISTTASRLACSAVTLLLMQACNASGSALEGRTSPKALVGGAPVVLTNVASKTKLSLGDVATPGSSALRSGSRSGGGGNKARGSRYQFRESGDDGTCSMTNVDNEQCVAAADEQKDAQLQEGPCSTDDAQSSPDASDRAPSRGKKKEQRWRVRPLGDGRFVLEMDGTQLCIGVTPAAAGKEAQVAMVPCSNDETQQWEAQDADDNGGDAAGAPSTDDHPRGADDNTPDQGSGDKNPAPGGGNSATAPAAPAAPAAPNGGAPAAPASAALTCPGMGPIAAADAAMEDEVVRLVNIERAKGGNCGGKAFAPSAPVVAQDQLRCAARLHSKDMAEKNYFEHDSQDGRTPWDRITQAGVKKYSTASENIGAGMVNAQDLMKGLMNSPGHCANILNGDSKQLGVGFFHSDTSNFKFYWTQDFATIP